MVKGIRHGISLRLFLEIVVTDFRSGVKSLLDVAWFEAVEHPVVMKRPDSGIEIRLKLQTDADPVRLLPRQLK